jgi:hypothetical protein
MLVQKHRQNGPADEPDVRVRILQAGASEPHAGVSVETEVCGLERRMLAREDDHRRDAAAAERLGDGGELDGFGACPDYQNYASRQPSP